MNIHDVNRSARQAGTTGSVRETSRSSEEEDVERVARPRPADQVEISEEGRNRIDEEGASVFPEVLSEIRGRIESGVYDTPAMAEAVAHRILESGDL